MGLVVTYGKGEGGNPGWFMPPGPADRPPSETLVTPGICYLPCQGIHKPEKSRQTTPGVKEPEKRKTHGAVRNEVVQVQLRRLEGH